MSAESRAFLCLQENKPKKIITNDTIFASVNRIISENDASLEKDSISYSSESLCIEYDTFIKDTILESERLQLIKELMVNENGISLESATDIMDSYIEENIFTEIGNDIKNTNNISKMKIEDMFRKFQAMIEKVWSWILTKIRELYLFLKRVKVDYTELNNFYHNTNIKFYDTVRSSLNLGLHWIYANDAIGNPEYDAFALPEYDTLITRLKKGKIEDDEVALMEIHIDNFKNKCLNIKSRSRGYYRREMSISEFLTAHSRVLSYVGLDEELKRVTQARNEIKKIVLEWGKIIITNAGVDTFQHDGESYMRVKGIANIMGLRATLLISNLYLNKINEINKLRNYMNELTIYMIKNKKKEV